MSRYYDDNVFHTGTMDQDDIYHYGVKGMKWRKRLARGIRNSAYNDQKKSHAAHTNSARSNQLFKQKSNSLSNIQEVMVSDNENRNKYSHNYGKKYNLSKGQKEALLAKYDKEYKDYKRAKKQRDKDRKKGNRLNRRANIKMKIAKIIGG